MQAQHRMSKRRRLIKMKTGRFTGQKRYILLFILGIMVFLYPTFSNLYYNYITMRSTDIEAYPSAAGSTNSTGKAETETDDIDTTVSDKDFKQIESDPSMKSLLNKELDYLKAYNIKLWKSPGETTDPFGENEGGSAKYEVSEDSGGASVFAYIKIDKIHQTLPVYLGATNVHLKKGVAVIQGTSIPVGGENTNSVIAGHTGMIQKFFTDLPEMKPGDEIQITNHWETLYYKVTGNKLIWPDQEEYLAVVPGKDMITLLTCYHGTPENDRLLVFAERYYPKGNTEKKTEEKKEENTDANVYSYLSKVELKVKPWYEKPQTFVFGAAGILLCLFLYISISKIRKNK